MAKAVGVDANIVAMLDDFLLVVPRKSTDTDISALKNGERNGKKFDKLLAQLNLPKAPNKDQNAAFSTIWCGKVYFSKKRLIGIPKPKWAALRKWVDTTFPLEQADGPPLIEAGALQSALGKFCHAMITWPAGRPCLYHLWRLLFTASFSNKDRAKLSMPHQTLELTPDCIGAITRWKQRLAEAAPLRRIIPCNLKVPATWVTILRYTSTLPQQKFNNFIATPSVSWWVEEPRSTPRKDSLIVSWMSLLLEALQVLDPSEGEPELIIVRTNIKLLAKTIESDCYVRSIEGARIASQVQDVLRYPKTPSGRQIPIELQVVLLNMEEDRLSGCIKAILN